MQLNVCGCGSFPKKYFIYDVLNVQCQVFISTLVTFLKFFTDFWWHCVQRTQGVEMKKKSKNVAIKPRDEKTEIRQCSSSGLTYRWHRQHRVVRKLRENVKTTLTVNKQWLENNSIVKTIRESSLWRLSWFGIRWFESFNLLGNTIDFYFRFQIYSFQLIWRNKVFSALF